MPAAVSAVQFSLIHPHLLAVGLLDGAVHVCDVTSTAGKSLLDSRFLGSGVGGFFFIYKKH
jgi:hypothetical protein